MILYLAGHAGALYLELIHRLTINRDKDSILVYGNKNLIGPIFDSMDIFVKEGIFKKVVFATECFGYNISTSEKDCADSIVSYYDKIFRINGINISDVDEVYLGVDTLNSYGVYFSLKHIPYNFMEMQRDFFLVAQHRVDVLPEETFSIYKKLMTKTGASSGVGEYVTRVIYPDSKYDVADGAKVSVFDFDQSLSSVSEKDRTMILRIFNVPEDYPRGDVNLLITCSNYVIRNEPDVRNKAVFIYQLIADYFIKNPDLPLVIKPHPLSRATIEDYRDNFDAFVFPRHFPSNYIPLLGEMRVKMSYTVASTGAVLSENGHSGICKVGFTFYRMHKIMMAMDYLTSLYRDVFPEYKLFTYGLSNEFMRSVLDYDIGLINHPFNWLDVGKIENNSFIIIDDINWNKGQFREKLIQSIINNNVDCIIAFVNSKKDFFFMDSMNVDNANSFFSADLNLKSIKSAHAISLQEPRLYFFVASNSDKEKIFSYNYFKRLKNAGYEIEMRRDRFIVLKNLN